MSEVIVVGGSTPSVLIVRESPQPVLIGAGGAAASVIAAGMRGAPGKDGAGTGSAVETFTAGETLGGHRAVFASGDVVRYASASAPDNVSTVVGITTQAAAAGNPVDVQRSGRITENTWSWVPGDVYLGDNGLLTQVEPAGVLLRIGVALDATTLDVRIGTPIYFD